MEKFSESFPYKRVVVTGGAGFLGRFIVERLRAFSDVEVFVPRSADYNLVEAADIKRLFADTSSGAGDPSCGSCRWHWRKPKKPGKVFLRKPDDGRPAYRTGEASRGKEVCRDRNGCAYPKFTPTPFREEDLWNGYPEETNAPYGLAKKMMLVQSQSYREQYGFNSIFLLPANLYGPGDNFDLESSHVIPALIRKCVEARDDRSAFRRSLGHRQRFA